LIMTELMNGVVNLGMAKRLMLLLRGVESAGDTMRSVCYFEDLWTVMGEDVGLEVLMGILEEEEKEERGIREEEEREIMHGGGEGRGFWI